MNAFSPVVTDCLCSKRSVLFISNLRSDCRPLTGRRIHSDWSGAPGVPLICATSMDATLGFPVRGREGELLREPAEYSRFGVPGPWPGATSRAAASGGL